MLPLAYCLTLNLDALIYPFLSLSLPPFLSLSIYMCVCVCVILRYIVVLGPDTLKLEHFDV